MFAACSSDQIELAEQTNEKTPNATPNTNGEEEAWPWADGVSVTVPNLELHGDQIPTRALVYDVTNKFMVFSWKNSTDSNSKDGDKIGVFPVNTPSSTSQQQCFVMTNDDIIEGANSVSAKFMNYDTGVLSVDAFKDYVSYFPYVEPRTVELDRFDYEKIPVKYLGQIQSANVNIYAYANRKTTVEQMNTYNESERIAASHLEAYDYLASNATSTANGGVHFYYTRLGSTVRFFIKAPEKIVYDNIQLVNKDALFMTKGTMNIYNKTLTATETSHVLSMQLGADGFDLSDETSIHYQNPSTGYIIAYMMLAPIKLKEVTSQCYLYICGHVKDHPEQKKYFKSAPLTKYDIEQNKTLQWTTTNNTPDEPITFNAISVEEWKEGTTFSNGDDGKGTEGW